MESMRKTSANYGLILGVILILAGAVMYAVDLKLFTNMWYGISFFVLIVIFGILAAVKSKSAMGGYMSFKQAFTAFFITMLIGVSLYTLFSIILFNFVDPGAKEVITDQMIKTTVETMEKFGAKTDDLDKITDEMAKTDNFGVAGQLKGLAMNLVIYSIIGLIAALIIKKERPESL